VVKRVNEEGKMVNGGRDVILWWLEVFVVVVAVEDEVRILCFCLFCLWIV